MNNIEENDCPLHVSSDDLQSSLPQSSAVATTDLTTSQETSQNNGIDIRQALDILSCRTMPHSHQENEHHHPQQQYGESTSCRCSDKNHDVSDELKKMGQTIDLLQIAPKTTTDVLSAVALSDAEDNSTNKMKSFHDEKEKQAEQHKAELKASLKSMKQTSDLLRILLQTQEDRVQTYRTYDSALEQVLISRNLSMYPPACALATASFSMLSDIIRAVSDEFKTRIDMKESTSTIHSICNMKQYFQWIGNLQKLEMEKLQLTAAIHLEKIRASNEKEEVQQEAVVDSGVSEHQRNLFMLQQGISTLQKKIDTCVHSINEVLEDFRCALIDEEE